MGMGMQIPRGEALHGKMPKCHHPGQMRAAPWDRHARAEYALIDCACTVCVVHLSGPQKLDTLQHENANYQLQYHNDVCAA